MRGKGTCTVEGCEKPIHATDYCRSHYMKWWRYGDPLLGREKRTGCKIEGCPKPHKSLGWCEMHYDRWRAHGSTDDPRLAGPRYRLEVVGYLSAHARVRRLLGDPKAHLCRHCEKQATDWAYDHLDPEERLDEGREYSLDPEHYIPLCRSCHRYFDADYRRRTGSAKLSDALVAEIRGRLTGTYGEHTALAREYGVNQTTISLIARGKSRRYG